ncbi:hypothetical protein M405DRAFT_841672 [Rhizopogon salebrosus TDB-379]|nr:hypothetical protein M405DRAFT_841672 [Rhizopogon salebrosus TDB-379]
MNVTHLARTGGPGKDVLSAKVALSGGAELKGTRALKIIEVYSQMYYDERVKHAADKVIAEENITSHGLKLKKHCEVTMEKYEAESGEVKARVMKEYKKAMKKSQKAGKQAKSGLRERVDDSTKIKAIRELPGTIDQVFRHLSYMTGGWKFTILMAGRDPYKSGEMRVFNYHLGQSEVGTEFSDCYVGFNDVLANFASFAEGAIIHEESLSSDDNVDIDYASSANEGTDDGSDEEIVNGGLSEQSFTVDDGCTQVPFNSEHVLYTLPSDDGTFANPMGDLAFDIDYSRLNPNDFVASLAAMNELEADANKEHASQTPYDLSSLDTFGPFPPSFSPLVVPVLDDTTMAQAASVVVLPEPVLSVSPVCAVATASSTPLATQSQGTHLMASQVTPVPGTKRMPSNAPSVTTTGPLTPLASPMIPQIPMPTPIQVEQPIAWRTCRAHPSIPFNRRELDNVIGSPNRPQNKKRRVDDATEKQPANILCIRKPNCS